MLHHENITLHNESGDSIALIENDSQFVENIELAIMEEESCKSVQLNDTNEILRALHDREAVSSIPFTAVVVYEDDNWTTKDFTLNSVPKYDKHSHD